MNRRSITASGTILLAAALVLAVPLSASAHIRLIQNTAKAGASPVQLTFTVPTEGEDTSVRTTNVEVDLPISTPFATLTVQPVPGWTSTVTKTALAQPLQVGMTSYTSAPTAVVWTSNPGTSLVAGQFQNFVVSVGPVPNVGKVKMTATQTLSDATTVRWDGADADHPAPTLYVNDTPPTSTGMAGMGMSSGSQGDAEPTATADGADQLPIALATIAVLLGGGALVISLRTARRSRFEAMTPRME